MNILRRKGDGQPRRTPFSLNTPLLRLSSNTSDYWTIGDSFEHTLIFGGTGSGKTSTSAAALATAFLKAGYGGCILCAKSDEAARWEAYARIAGRPTSTIRFDASGRYRFNFLDYLMHRPGDGGGSSITPSALLCMSWRQRTDATAWRPMAKTISGTRPLKTCCRTPFRQPLPRLWPGASSMSFSSSFSRCRFRRAGTKLGFPDHVLLLLDHEASISRPEDPAAAARG